MKKTVVIIENDQDIKYIVNYILKSEGYNVILTSEFSIQDLLSYKADLILLDEWVNARESDLLCLEIKQIHNLKHIPVIIFSTSPKIEKIAESCQADGYVRKPFNIDDLLNEVRRCCFPNLSSVT